MKGKTLSIKLNPGSIAPRYEEGKTKELTVKTAVITEQGMASRLPLVDMQMEDAEGNQYFFMITGKLINALSASIKGVNKRIHGTEEP